MELQSILGEVRLVLATLPTEVDFLVVSRVAYAEYTEGAGTFDLASFLARLLDQAEGVFPDANTRPFAVLILQAWARLLAGPVSPPELPGGP